MLMSHLLAEGGNIPNTELAWLLYTVGVIFLLVIAVGWWSGTRKKDEPNAQPEKPDASSKSGHKKK